MEFKEKLESTLTNPASGIVTPEFDLESINKTKAGGFVISETFKGLTQLDRQNLIWDYLESNLSQEELNNIVSLITVTPDEYKDED